MVTNHKQYLDLKQEGQSLLDTLKMPDLPQLSRTCLIKRLNEIERLISNYLDDQEI